ncbi:MAG: hypothetical protein L0227_15305, partial [Chloroflexi bacterium]|nr:hypothetical protein [Chloroflexota bacterium]
MTDIDIVSDHAIIKAAGLDGDGTIAIYEFPGRLQWGNNLIDDAEVLAVATDGFDEDGDGVSDDVVAFVVEPGAELVDGSELAGLRIGCWIHSTDDGFINQTPRSLDFWDAMVAYALDSTEPMPGVCSEPPATATRAIQTALPPGQATCGGDFKDGDAISVEIQIADLRAAAGDCAVPAAVRVTETPPSGWAVSGVSDGGTVADEAITWTLAGGDLAAGKTLTYSVAASAPDLPQRFTFKGELVELDAAGDPVEGQPDDVVGEDSLLSDPDDCPGKAVIILANPASPPAGDRAMIDRLEQEFGMETVLVDDNDPEASKIAVIEAELPTLIFVFESVSSGNVAAQLNDRPEPVIFHEPFLYDDMGFVAGTTGCDNCWGDLGNDFGNQSGESDLDIVNQDHPIIRQAGLQDVDTFATFEPAGRLLWGR